MAQGGPGPVPVQDGVIYDSQLNNPDKARKYWEEAADRYPNTAYGRSALDKL